MDYTPSMTCQQHKVRTVAQNEVEVLVTVELIKRYAIKSYGQFQGNLNTHKKGKEGNLLCILRFLKIYVYFFWAFGEIKCHEKSIKHYVSETRTVLARSLFSWVRQATLTSTSGQQMCNHAKKTLKD